MTKKRKRDDSSLDNKNILDSTLDELITQAEYPVSDINSADGFYENDVTSDYPEREENSENVESQEQILDVANVDQEVIVPENALTEDNSIISEEKQIVEVPSEPLKKKRRKKKRSIADYSLDNDIKYKAPLSYRHLRILAWGCLILSQIGALMSLVGRADPTILERDNALINFLSIFSTMMMPYFLLATLSTILNRSKSFYSMLILYGAAALLVYALSVLVHERFLVNTVAVLMKSSRADAASLIDGFLSLIVKGGYLSFNIFIDLLICTLFAYFVLYKPTKYFVGKKLTIFRLFALLPVLYEVASFVLKMLASFNIIKLSFFIYPLLTTKPPLTFIVFVLLATYVKHCEYVFRKKGKTEVEYNDFLKTRANSWLFSKFAARWMFIAGIIDALLLLVLSLGASARFMTEGVDFGDAFSLGSSAVSSWGIGKSVPLILVSPVVLLFSYTKQHNPKTKILDTVLPLPALLCLALIYLEALSRLIIALADKISQTGT